MVKEEIEVMFKGFCDGWNRKYEYLRAEGASKTDKGNSFEEYFKKFLRKSRLVPLKYKILHKRRLNNINHEFDFVIIRGGFNNNLNITEVLGIIETKSHAYWAHFNDKEKFFKDFEDYISVRAQVKKLNPKINFFFINFKDKESYSKRIKEKFEEYGEDLSDYYLFNVYPTDEYDYNSFIPLYQNFERFLTNFKKLFN